MKISYNWLNIIQNYLLPPTCILCGNAGLQGLDLCHVCLQQLPQHQPGCVQCADVLKTSDFAVTRCGRCIALQPAFDKVYAPFSHQGAIRHLIMALKFNADYKNGRLLGNLLADYVKQNAKMPDVIIPIPLHPLRYYQRGFNQSLEIARRAAKQLAIPLDVQSCVRHRNTPHQTALSASERQNNIKDAFSVIKSMRAQHVAIVDDVITTGSTAHELARVLKHSGVRQVDVWVCARA